MWENRNMTISYTEANMLLKTESSLTDGITWHNLISD